MKKKNRLNQYGITLIALVITVIVLLILAGISISAITGEEGIINETLSAVEDYEESEENEEDEYESIFGPKEANIKLLNEDEINIGESIEILVKHNTRNVAIDVENCRYILTNSIEKIGTELELYLNGGAFTDEVEQLSISSINSEDSYYLHVLTVDDDGYSKETVSTAIAVGHAHIYEENIVVAATCLNTGILEHKCSVCDESYQEEISATGHNYISAVVAATCTSGGYTTHTCEYCNDAYTDTVVIATGHSYSNTSTVAATCTTSGYYKYTCSDCSEFYTTTISALGHNTYNTYVEDWDSGRGCNYILGCTRCSEKNVSLGGDFGPSCD